MSRVLIDGDEGRVRYYGERVFVLRRTGWVREDRESDSGWEENVPFRSNYSPTTGFFSTHCNYTFVRLKKVTVQLIFRQYLNTFKPAKCSQAILIKLDQDLIAVQI